MNTTGMFLGAIILGNGINYPDRAPRRGTASFARAARRRPRRGARPCRTRFARSSSARASRRSRTARSTVTQFRGFNQFGVDRLRRDAARVGLDDPVRARAPRRHRADPGASCRRGCAIRRRACAPDGSRGPDPRSSRAPPSARPGRSSRRAVARDGGRRAAKLPAFLRDPWEYNFDQPRLARQQARRGGRVVEQGRAGLRRQDERRGRAACSPTRPSRCRSLKARILDNDAADPQGRAHRRGRDGARSAARDARGADAEARGARPHPRSAHARASSTSLPDDERARVEELRPPERLRVLDAEGPAAAPAPPLRGERRARRDGLLREVQERRLALGRAQPASHREDDRQRAPPRRDRRADGEPRRRSSPR